jgi:hypothetical protein
MWARHEIRIITVSRGAGAGGAYVATALGKRLGWPVVDKALAEEVARRLQALSFPNIRTAQYPPSGAPPARRAEQLRGVPGNPCANGPRAAVAGNHKLGETVTNAGAGRTPAHHGPDRAVGRGRGRCPAPATPMRTRSG